MPRGRLGLYDQVNMAKTIRKITPFLWLHTQAEEDVKFYTSVFKDSKIKHVSRYGEGGPGAAGSVRGG